MSRTPTPVRIGNDDVPRPALTEFLDLVDKANAGDEGAARALRPRLDALPALAEQLGDFSKIVRAALVKTVAGEQLGFAEALEWKLDALRTELTQPSDGPLERLLVGRVVLCWLQVHQAEGLYAQRMGSLDLAWNEAYQRRIDRAQRRYIQAIRTLAQVRRLAVPLAVQINVAEQQVNQVLPGVRPVP